MWGPRLLCFVVGGQESYSAPAAVGPGRRAARCHLEPRTESDADATHSAQALCPASTSTSSSSSSSFPPAGRS